MYLDELKKVIDFMQQLEDIGATTDFYDMTLLVENDINIEPKVINLINNSKICCNTEKCRSQQLERNFLTQTKITLEPEAD